MYKAVPPLQEMFNMAGMELPSYLKGKDISTKDEIVEPNIISDNSEEKI